MDVAILPALTYGATDFIGGDSLKAGASEMNDTKPHSPASEDVPC
jgi:hypothetical protein